LGSDRKQIETYHQIVLAYATRSRIYTITALGAGFIFIAIISGIAIFNDEASTITASIVTATSAALTGFVARAALRNSEASSQELRSFFEHPLDLERALAAERLVNAMPPNGQGAARLIIINYLAGRRDGATALPAASQSTSPDPTE
jgi:hypothetical protein